MATGYQSDRSGVEVDALLDKIDALQEATTSVSGLMSSADKQKLDQMASVTTEDKVTWNAKQDAIADLSDIRSGAALGATALQSYTETDPTVPNWAKQPSKPTYTAQEVGALPDDTPLFSGDYNDLSNTPTIPDISGKADKATTLSGYGITDAKIVSGTITLGSSTITPLTSAHEIPSGGNAGQVLSKNSATDYDVHWVNQTTTYPSAYCTTAAGTAAKKASCSLWTATANTYLHILIGADNTSASALTLNVNSTGAKPIYINGSASSSSNYTLPAGTYIVFYDGTNFYFRTDGKIQGLSGTLVCTNSTAGLLKNDGTIDTNTYLTSHQDISGKEDRVSVGTINGTSLSASLGTYYVGSSVGTLAVTLPTVSDTTHVASVVLNIATGSSPAVTFTAASGVTISYSKGFALEASKEYEVNCLWQGTKWIVMATEVETPS